jgi:hypothetical protein
MRVARSLLPDAARMWFVLDHGLAERDGAEQMLFMLAAISQFNEELRVRLAGDGVDGVDGAFALYRRLDDALGHVPRTRVDEMRAELARVVCWLGDALGRLEDLRWLKRALP